VSGPSEIEPENEGNHSCDPNLDKNHIALRDIDAGEELTVDYAQFSDKDWSMDCNCGAKSCKGIVEGSV
jgi:SET domain-containing protein